MGLMQQLRLPQSLRLFSSGPVRQNMCWPKPDYGPMEVQRSALLNGIRVAAAKPLGAPIAACTVMWQAGSRYEVDDQLGASHFIRAASSASGMGYTQYAKMRVLQQNGCFITCTTDRQSVAFSMRGPLTNFADMKHFLLDVAARCSYHQWELDDRKALVYEDLVRLTPEQRVMDLVQTACWAGPLANSMYCPEARIDSMSERSLNCFAANNFKTNECTVASYGVPFEETLKLAELIEFCREIPSPRCQQQSCPRRGFEYYDLGAGSETWIALAVPGVGTCDVNGLFKHAIIAAACGVGDMQTGSHAMDRAPMSPLGSVAGLDVHTNYRAFNISYWDTGVFGVVAKTRADTASEVAQAAVEFLTNVGDLSFKQIDVGKARLKLNMARHDEDCVRVSEGLALQIANNVQMDCAANSIALIDCISNDDIAAVAKALSDRCKDMAVAVVGDVGAVPPLGPL